MSNAQAIEEKYGPNARLMYEVSEDVVIEGFSNKAIQYAKSHPNHKELAFKPKSIPTPPFCVVEYKLVELDGSTELGKGWEIINLDEVREELAKSSGWNHE